MPTTDPNATLDKLPLAIFVKDAESRIVFMNRACEGLWGIRFEDVRGGDGSDFFPPDQMEGFLAKDRELFANGLTEEFEEIIWNNALKQNRIVHTIKKPLYTPDGKPESLIGILFDITDRAHSETEYRTILKTTQDGFWINDTQARFLDVNEEYCRMIGYERDELLQMSVPDIEAIEQPEETQAHIERVLIAGFDRFQTRHRRKNGRLLDVEVTVTYIPVADGRMLVFVRDITAQKEAENTLITNEARFRSIFENANTGIAFANHAGTLIDFNDAFQRMLGYPRKQLHGMNFAKFTHPDDLSREMPLLDEVLQGRGDHYRLEKRLIAADDEVRWVDGFVSAIRNTEGNVINFVGIVTDITARRQAENKLSLYANVFQHSGEGILISDANNDIVAVNRAFTHLTGYEEAEVIGKNPHILASGKTPRKTYQAMWAALNEAGFWQGELWDRRKDGSIYPKWTAITAMRSGFGTVTNYIASFSDISQRKAAEEQISHLAHHDALTSLYNRFSLQDRLEQAVLSAQRDRKQVAVMFLDLDHFKSINDTLGHQTGDQLLVEVAQRLMKIVRGSDIVARLGGDEFVVVLTRVEDDVAAATVAEKITQVLGEPYFIDGNELHSSPSIGIGLYPNDGANGQALMKSADTAMYHAKAQGRNNFQFFTAEMNTAAIRRMKLERDLRVALAKNQLLLHYQPQIEAATRQFCGVEALVRWLHPEEGLIPPNSFIQVAEDSGLILPLGGWVLNEACRQMAQWKKDGITGFHVAVNISAHQLESPNFLEQVSTALTEHGLSHGDLELEITETTAMANPEHAIALLLALRDLGVELAIDDFGTGYSSLAYLKRLPIHTLKLDLSFVKDIETDQDDAAICAATIALAHKLGIKVVAEGVETEAQRYFLSTVHGCDILQGYLFSRPLTAAGLEEWLANRQ